MNSSSFASRINRFDLANGITLLVLENHANPTISLSGYVRAGEYFNPPDKDSLATITASMLNKGTARRSKLEIAEELESAGARVGFSPNNFSVSIGGQSLSRDLPLIISTMAEELREPTFPEDELGKLKQRFIASIKEDLDDTRSRAYERMTQLVFAPGNPFYRLPPETTIANIETITADDARAFYSKYYGVESMVLVVVGDVAPNAVRDLIETHLGDWQGASAAEINFAETPLQTEPKRQVVQMKDKANCDVVIGHASRLRRSNPDYLAAVIANNALGQSTLSSRLGLKVRDEMGLTYGISSGFRSGIGDGPFTIGVTVASQNIDLAINTTLDIVNDYIATGISEAELECEQSAVTGSYKIGLATNAGMASQIVNSQLFGLGINYLDEFPSHIAALTKAQIDEAIRKYFHPEVATTVIAGTI
ncbi:MAG: insulinase family protein [Acidobacteriota bacterium]|nr:insulinase family protein [Acidobacteriota bacterium]